MKTNPNREFLVYVVKVILCDIIQIKKTYPHYQRENNTIVVHTVFEIHGTSLSQ